MEIQLHFDFLKEKISTLENNLSSTLENDLSFCSQEQTNRAYSPLGLFLHILHTNCILCSLIKYDKVYIFIFFNYGMVKTIAFTVQM